MIEMVHARVGFACVCGGGAFPPPSWPTVHQKRAQHAECVPLTPHECAWHTEPVLLPWGSVPFHSGPFLSVPSSRVQSSVPRPCTRACAHATQRARHPEPLRTHTQPGHGTPRTPIQHQTPRWFDSSHRKSRETPVASIVELAEVGTPAPSRHKRGNPHGHSAARGPPCWCNTPCRRRRRQPPAPSRTCRWSRSPAPRPRGTRPGG